MATDKTPTPEELEALARKHGATSYRNRADTQHPAYGFTEDGLRSLLADVLAKRGQPAGATEEVENLRKALVYAAFALHGTPQYMLAQGITLIDGDTVRVSRDGWTVEASDNPHPQPVARVQLTPERVKEIVRGAGYDQRGIPDTERSAFINGLRHGEQAHGIKGGQP